VDHGASKQRPSIDPTQDKARILWSSRTRPGCADGWAQHREPGNVSVDGYIADAQGNIDWSDPSEELVQYWNDFERETDLLFRKNKDQRALDKEPLREWMAERGFRGDGEAPVMTDEVRIATATRYILLAEELTQRPFKALELTAAEQVASILRD